MRRMIKIRRLLSWKGKEMEAEWGITMLEWLKYHFKTVYFGAYFFNIYVPV